MSKLPVTLVARDYDYLSPLANGDVEADGIDLTLIRAFDALPRVANDQSIHGGEASFSRYLHGLVAGDRSLVGLPVFLMRDFRHRCFFVRRDSGLAEVTDLAGKRTAPTNGRRPATPGLVRSSASGVSRSRMLTGSSGKSARATSRFRRMRCRPASPGRRMDGCSSICYWTASSTP